MSETVQNEPRFKITEREKYLLQVMAQIIAENFRPVNSLKSQGIVWTKILNEAIEKSTVIVPF